MTVKDLRDGLAMLGPGHDNSDIKVWLPGSTITLGNVFVSERHKAVMIEGNVDASSALDDATPILSM